MQYYLTNDELSKMESGLKVAMAIPFIDDIEDYILEAIWEYSKNINGIDPFYNIRSKKLYDVVDTNTNIGWSIKSLQWSFYNNCQFELVIQRADVFKKAKELGFPPLDKNSDPNLIGAALLKHWHLKVESDANSQHVNSKRILILLNLPIKGPSQFLRKILNCTLQKNLHGNGPILIKMDFKVLEKLITCVYIDGIHLKNNFLKDLFFQLLHKKLILHHYG